MLYFNKSQLKSGVISCCALHFPTLLIKTNNVLLIYVSVLLFFMLSLYQTTLHFYIQITYKYFIMTIVYYNILSCHGTEPLLEVLEVFFFFFSSFWPGSGVVPTESHGSGVGGRLFDNPVATGPPSSVTNEGMTGW